MRRRPWSEVRVDFRQLVGQRGADSVARKVHVHRATIYRLVSGQTRRPSGPLRAAIEEAVAEATDSRDTMRTTR